MIKDAMKEIQKYINLNSVYVSLKKHFNSDDGNRFVLNEHNNRQNRNKSFCSINFTLYVEDDNNHSNDGWIILYDNQPIFRDAFNKVLERYLDDILHDTKSLLKEELVKGKKEVLENVQNITIEIATGLVESI